MKTIIVINDGSAEAEHAAKMALNIAKKVNADLLLANLSRAKTFVHAKQYVLTADGVEDVIKVKYKPGLLKQLKAFNDPTLDFEPQIGDVNVSEFSESDLAQLIIKNNIWMIVTGIRENTETSTSTPFINIHCVLNRVMCPLLLVPEKYQLKDFEQIVYMADLRYCQLPVVRYLAQLAKPYEARLLIAHLSAKGLPDMEEKYAYAFFNDAIGSNVNYNRLLFNNIREKNVQKVIDVMINGMHTNLLVLINHQFHFEELMGNYITNILPQNITIPLLVFPS